MNLRRYALLFIFAVFLWGFSLFDILSPPRDFSDMENRPLAQSPAFSAGSLVSNAYTLKYEDYVVDQFAVRDGWITIKSLGETALLKTENNGVIYGRDGYLFEPLSPDSSRQMERNLGYIRDFSRMYGDTPITLGVIPGSYAIYPEKLPAGAPAADEQALISECRTALAGEPIAVLDLISALSAHKDEYIYFRTDHHWTTLGAYYAYTALMDSAGYPEVPLDTFERRHTATAFYGTYYSKAKNWNALPDAIVWYDVPVSRVEIDGEPKEGLYDFSMFEKRDKYAAFLHGNNGLTVIRADNADNSGRILLIKDSYGNSFAPYLAASFEEVHVVDLRYFNNMSELMAKNDYDMICVLYGASALSQDINIYKLGQ